ncbi:NAD(P)/FAD-dependent oxidoreductase [Corynebacterium comes]|uniref:Rhodocoxin reductase n=1 Tax=Corynebacterium comes TaxID=2675218 RepID=A0A6B8VEX1_9CORY|nr:FAD-dependent oxidoreductase [Corynebacterium comes]QGU03792.1 Rhodocoxin reductase [Corynebacterium comes]
MSAHVVIVGNGIAGLTAGDTLRRLGYEGTITVVGEEPHATYSRPALSKVALAPGDDLDVGTLPAATHGATELLGRTVTGLDPANRVATLDDGTELTYDGLVIATGSHARRFTDSPREYTIRSLDDAARLKASLVNRPTVTVIGGGPLGMEVASGAVGLGCDVTLIHPGTPMELHLGPLLGGILTRAALEQGLNIIDSMVSSVREEGEGMAVTLTDGTVLTSDLVVTAAGDLPNTAWLESSGLLVDGRLIADERCRVTDSIVAAGDVVLIDRGEGPRRTPIWTAAIEQAKVAAAALIRGDDADPLDFQSYFWTDQWGLNLKMSGPIPQGTDPVVVKGSLEERSAVLHWPESGTAAALNMRMPIPRLHTLARTEPATP